MNLIGHLKRMDIKLEHILLLLADFSNITGENEEEIIRKAMNNGALYFKKEICRRDNYSKREFEEFILGIGFVDNLYQAQFLAPKFDGFCYYFGFDCLTIKKVSDIAGNVSYNILFEHDEMEL